MTNNRPQGLFRGRWGLPRKPRALVVDDEPKLVRLVREVLSSIGFEVMSTASGESAVEMAAVEQPDLIVLDIVLRDNTDGYAVARRVREFSDVPILMLTAKSREADLLRGFEVGADDYLTKPFSSRELVARARALLKRAPGRRDGGHQPDRRRRSARRPGAPPRDRRRAGRASDADRIQAALRTGHPSRPGDASRAAAVGHLG